MRCRIARAIGTVAFVGYLCAVDASRLTPSVLPLVVRNPYLSVWLADAREEPWLRWPMFYEGQDIGLAVLAAVPETGKVYPLLGRPQDSLDPSTEAYNISYPIYLGPQFDASTTNLTYSIPIGAADVHPLKVTLSFASPITPSSTLRQSIPAAYLGVQITGGSDVNIYVDVNGQWVSGDEDSRITWDLALSGLRSGERSQPILKTWKVKREIEQLYTEFRDQAEWGTLHFSAPVELHHESGSSALLRQQFARTGVLQNQVDRSFRSVMDDEPVFAFAKSFNLSGTSSGSQSRHDSVLFTIAHTQDPVAQYASARGLTIMRPLWASWFDNSEALIAFHHGDYGPASALAANYSAQLALDASRLESQEYADVLALSARQVLGATSFSGTPDNPMLFLKEISSNGNCQTVDVIFPSFPFFLYTNPRWLAYLLEPLIEHMASGQYPNKYAMHDLGAHFPNLTGHSDGRDEYMPLEECGNMLIMGLALANSLDYDDCSSSGSIWASLGEPLNTKATMRTPFALASLGMSDGIYGFDNRWGGSENHQGRRQAKAYLERNYHLWKQWTGYLVNLTLTPETQLSTDDFAGSLANQTNLALKGILGIKAMSKIAEMVGRRADVEYYQNISSVYIQKWQEYGLSRDQSHAKLAYHWYGSWTTIYNLFADLFLCFHLPTAPLTTATSASLHKKQAPLQSVYLQTNSDFAFIPKHIYKIQSDWYHSVLQKYGLPLDSRHLYAKSDWEFFAAAVTSKRVRTEIAQRIALWVNETLADRPFIDLYETEGGGNSPGPSFKARPVVGGHFSLVALDRTCAGRVYEALRFLDDDDDD